MNSFKIKILSLGLLLIPLFSKGQQVMSLQDFLKAGIEKNYGIRIQEQQADMAHNNNTLGNAGYLPVIGTDATYSGSIQNINQKYVTGLEQTKNNAKTRSIMAGVELDWTIFDGMKMFATKDLLETQDMAAQLNYRNQVEQTAQDMMSAYYDMVRQQQQLKVLQESMNLSKTRLELGKTRYEIGSASKLEYLQSKVDYNADSSALLKQISTLTKAKLALLNMADMPLNSDFKAADSIILMPDLTLADLKQKVQDKNYDILLAKADKQAAENNLQIQKGNLLPELSLTTRYNFSNVEAQAGFLTLNQTKGLNYGVTARWNLFNGFNTSRQIQNVKIQQNIAQLNLDAVKNSVNTNLGQAYSDYQSNLAVVALEKENLDVVAQNMDIAQERYKIGRANVLEYREAQIAWTEAKTRLLNAVYSAKVSEIQLLRLSGQMGNLK